MGGPRPADVDMSMEGRPSAFDITEFEDTSGQLPWTELDFQGKVVRVLTYLIKLALVLGLLYMFIASLSFLADSFRLLAGKEAAETFRNGELLENPIAGLVIGVLATVLVQSSSTSTSIVISMVAADLLTKKSAIYIVMGANIGTSVTSTIVALGQVTDRDQFIRAFACATVHDAFNFLTVLVFLPLEWITGYLDAFSKYAVDQYGELETDENAKKEYLKKLTKDFTKMVCSLDKKLITKIAEEGDPDKLAELEAKSLLKDSWVKDWGMSDRASGALFLIISLTILCICLYSIVKILNSVFRGPVAKMLHKIVNTKFDDRKVGPVTIPLSEITGYLAMLAGLGITIGVQSSSITTSVLTPLVGVGVISIDTVYPVVLGANIGTTMTAVLAALASSSSKIAITLEVAYCHLFFNLSGITLFYVIWPLRTIPISMAKYMGNRTANYKWYAIVYLIVCFFLVPLLLIGLSLAHMWAMGVFVISCLLTALTMGTLSWFQANKPEKLPEKYKTMEFLPEFLQSLEPMDRAIRKLGCCSRFTKATEEPKVDPLECAL